MTDGIVVANSGVGGASFAVDTIAGTSYPYGKLAWGPSGTVNEVDNAAGKRLPVDGSGVTQPVSAASLPLPTGASTEATLAGVSREGAPITGQTLEAGGSSNTGWLSSIRKAITDRLPAALVGGRLDINIGADGVGLSKEGTPITGQTLEAGGANAEGWLSSLRKAITDRLGLLGQQTMANSTPVVIASNQSAVPVSGTVTANVGTTGGLALDATLTGGTAKSIPVAGTSGGATPFKLISAASTNSTNVKGSSGTLYGIQATNINAAVRYLKVYDKAAAPTVGTDTPVKTLAIPGNAAGAGIVVPFPVGVTFANGIGIAITTGSADADTGAVAAGDIIVNLDYK